MNVEIRHLRAFTVTARELHFARAAERLHLSQPALSQTIRQLEAALGFRVLRRTTRSVALTAEGEILLAEARAVLARYDEAMAQAQRLADGELGRLRVGYMIGAAVDHVPAILRAFAQTWPDVRVETREFDFGHPAAGLDDGSSDVAILRPPLEPELAERVELRTLLREARVVCLASQHPLAARERVAAAELLAEPIVAAPGSGVWRDDWLLVRQRGGEPPPVVHEAATFEAELQAVAAGRGISTMPASSARFYARPGVAWVPIGDVEECEVAVAIPHGAPPQATRFAEVAERVIAQARAAWEAEQAGGG